MSRRSLLLAALGLAIAIAVISTLPTATKHAMHLQGPLHPWLHLCGFAGLAFLLLGAFRSIPGRVLLLAALLAFGYATEAGESRNDGWPIEQRDVRNDAIGVLLGAGLALVFSRGGAEQPTAGS